MLDSFYLQYLFGGFVSLIVITNPLSKIPLFISLTQGMSLDVRKKQANWSCYYAAAIMLVSLAAGNLLLVFFGISYGALRISGGFVVGIIGYQMLFGSRDQGGAPVVRRDKDDYSFFPIAMPGISGPGTIAVVIGIASEIAELPNVMDMAGAFFMTGVAIVLTCAVTWIVLRSADYISGRLGPSGTSVSACSSSAPASEPSLQVPKAHTQQKAGDFAGFLLLESKRDDYSVVTLLARFLGLSTSVPFAMAV